MAGEDYVNNDKVPSGNNGGVVEGHSWEVMIVYL